MLTPDRNPSPDRPRRTGWPAVLLAGLAVAGPGWAVALLLGFGRDVDGTWYRALCDGGVGVTCKPFANRWLVPTLVRAAAMLPGVSTEASWLGWGIAGGLAFAVAATRRAADAAGSLLTAAVLLAVPGVAQLLSDQYMPDLYNAAVLAAFFVAVAGRRYAAAAALVFVAQLVRESTILLAAIAGWVLWRRGLRRPAAGVVLAAVAGAAVTAVVTRGALPDMHGLGTVRYTLLKVPFNLAKNVFGVTPWSNTLAVLASTGDPVWAIDLPRWLRLGGIGRVGVQRFDPALPLGTLVTLLSVFGVLPTLLARAWSMRRRDRRAGGATSQTRDYDPAVVIALAYGAACLVAAPVLGASVNRLALYAWTLLLAFPALRPAVAPDLNPRRLAALAALHLAAAWAPALLVAAGVYGTGTTTTLAAGLVLAHAAAIRIARPAAAAPAAEPAARDPVSHPDGGGGRR